MDEHTSGGDSTTAWETTTGGDSTTAWETTTGGDSEESTTVPQGSTKPTPTGSTKPTTASHGPTGPSRPDIDVTTETGNSESGNQDTFSTTTGPFTTGGDNANGADFTTGQLTSGTDGTTTTGGDSTTAWETTTGGDSTAAWETTTGGDYTTAWETTTGGDSTTVKPDPTTLPPDQCVDEGCSMEHDGWGECVDFSKDVDWQRLTTEFDLGVGHVAGKCGNARVGVEECCKCMKAKIHHTTTTTLATKPWYHYEN